MSNKKIQNISDKALSKKTTVSKSKPKEEPKQQKKESSKPKENKSIPFNNKMFTLFEEAYQMESEIEKASLFKEIASDTGHGIREIKADYKKFEAIKKEQIKKEDNKKLPSILNKSFSLGYDPSISYGYTTSHGFLEYSTEKEHIKLCNIFSPISKINSKFGDKEISYLKLHMNSPHGRVEIVEMLRDFIKPERLANIFADIGFALDSKRASKIATFISDFNLDNQDNIKEEKGKLQTGWDNGVFYLPQREQNVIWIESSLKKSYAQKGNVENQKKLMLELAKDKVFINVLGAFASPLLGIIDLMNFTIHNGGLTEGGKSLAVKCALSFFGNPSKIGNNWNATPVGLETYFEQNNYMPTWLDEMEMVDKDLSFVSKMIYQFSDGHGKTRGMVKDELIKNRDTKEFNGILFTTAEKSLEEVQNSINNTNKKRGLTGRTLDFNIRDMWGQANDTLVKEILDNNYGFLGVNFIEHIEVNQEQIKNSFNIQKEFFNGVVNGRKRDQFALLKLTLEILYEMKLLNEHLYETQISNLKYFASLEARKIEEIKDIYTEFKEKYTEFIVSNRGCFDFKTEFGINEHIKDPFMGVVNMTTNKISVFKNSFSEWCLENGFVKEQILETLESKMKIEVAKDREKYRDKNMKFNGKVIKIYRFTGLFDNDIEIKYETIKENPTYTEVQATISEPSLMDEDNGEIPF